ncbi:hypothetical protein [Nostoc sp. JL23]|uniref:hypothetical protein n=2 Tax=unclassified Nostoc TaxID=2593658 RepID=UPI001D2C23A8|nr:hypothetical protein [Nostoc sp. JL23]MBN3877303.1 hypothetical protein [Nostoc sp. JL23]
MKVQHTKLVLAGLLIMGCIGLLRSLPVLSQPSTPTQSTAIRETYQGSWTGRLQYVGFQGQMLLFIDKSGKLYGSFESDDGDRFAQISGTHRGNAFHLTFTPTPDSSYLGNSSEPYIVNAIATWKGGNRFILGVPGSTGHPQSYIFERK